MTKRRQRSNLGRELDWIWYDARKITFDQIKQLRKFVKILCHFLGLSKVPKVNFCDTNRQAECIRRKATNPCGGACYCENEILIRDHYFGQDDILHELFHHVNALNDSKAIQKIMYGWYRWFYQNEYDYRKRLREALGN